jgi:PPOX class probable F420-dependent enzyme
MAEKIQGRVAELLGGKNFAQVATTRKDGTVNVTPVWVDHDGDHVLLNTSEGRAWPASARRTGQIAMNVLNHENPYEYVYIQGSVDQGTHEGAEEHIDRMAQKYLGVDKYPYHQPGDQRILFKVTPEKVTHVNQG